MPGCAAAPGLALGLLSAGGAGVFGVAVATLDFVSDGGAVAAGAAAGGGCVAAGAV